MLSRVTACSLVVLVLLPFTAPFRTCDLSAFFAARTQRAPISKPAAKTLASDSSIANVPAISRIGRVRLLDSAGVAIAAVESFRPLTRVAGAAACSRSLRERAVLPTILRV
jgi:hypothetical protein